MNFSLRDQRVPPLDQNRKNFKICGFFFKNHIFSSWIWILHVLSFLLMYITYIFQKFLKFSFLAREREALKVTFSFSLRLVKKYENLKNFCKTYVIYIKRKLRTCRIQIQIEKVWFFFKGGTLWCRNDQKNFLQFFKFSKKNFEIFFPNFFAINHTFSIWIWILHVLSFLLMYITYTFIKIFEFSLFYYEFSVDYQLHSSASHGKIVIKSDHFWYLWTTKDQNFVLRTIFGHQHANWLP